MPSHIAETAINLALDMKVTPDMGLDLMHERYPSLSVREAIQVFTLIEHNRTGHVRRGAHWCIALINFLRPQFPHIHVIGDLLTEWNKRQRPN